MFIRLIKNSALLLFVVGTLSSCVFTQKNSDATHAFYQTLLKSTLPPGTSGLDAFRMTFYPFAQTNCASCHGGNTSPNFAGMNVESAYSVAKDSAYMNFSSVSSSKLALYAGNGHCGTMGCSAHKDAALLQLQAWADAENANTVESGPSTGPIVESGPATGGASSSAFISQSLALPTPLPTGIAYRVMRWPLSALTPSSALVSGAIFEMEVQLLSKTTYRVRNPRILGLKSVVKLTGLHVFVKPSTDSGIGVEDLGAGSVWENDVVNLPVSTLPATLPTGPIVTTPVVPPIDTFANIIGVRSNQDSFTIAFDKLETSAALSATFTSINLNILVPKCLSCHSTANPAGGVSYSSYGATTAANNFNSATPAQSRLYLSTLGAGASMPIGGTKLTAGESAILLNWLNAGAPNN